MRKPPAFRVFLCTCVYVAAFAIVTDSAAQSVERASWLGIPITRTAVASSNLASVGYAAEAKVLEVEFQSGAIYRYREVPQEVYAALMEASSKGQYFVRRIRGQFDFQRVKEHSP